MLSKIAAALGVPVARGDYSGVPPNRADQGAPANYAPFGAMDGSNLLGDDGAPALFTAGEEFGTVSRGDPVVQEMDAEAQLAACLTEETWRLEITAHPFAEGVVHRGGRGARRARARVATKSRGKAARVSAREAEVHTPVLVTRLALHCTAKRWHWIEFRPLFCCGRGCGCALPTTSTARARSSYSPGASSDSFAL